MECTNEIIAEGYSAHQVLYQVLAHAPFNPWLMVFQLQERLIDENMGTESALMLSRLQIQLAESEKALLDGADEHLQLLTLAMAIHEEYRQLM
jgi:hypothetical protein